MEYRKFILKIEEPPEWCDVVKGMDSFGDWIMVNVAGATTDPGILFLPENVQGILDSWQGVLYLEGVVPEEYYLLLSKQTICFLEAGAGLRERLRLWRVSQLLGEMQDYLGRMQNLLQFILCHDCQRPSLLSPPIFDALKQAVEQLSVAAFYHEDNVRCMDHLKYELTPCLLELQEQVAKRRERIDSGTVS